MKKGFKMNIAEFEKLFAELKNGYKLNPFSVLALQDKQLENFHSKVIASLMDERGGSGYATVFRNHFLEFLEGKATILGKNEIANDLASMRKNCKQIKIDTEYSKKSKESYGRIDILIRDEKTKNAIIIENKINGAPDMSRQLIRYLNGAEVEGCKVAAIVYLKAYDDNGCPDWGDWKDDERNRISQLLIPMSACKNGDAFSIVTWIENVSAKNNSFAIVAEQYKDFIDEFRSMDKTWSDMCKCVGGCIKSLAMKNDERYKWVVDGLPKYFEKRVLTTVSPCEFQMSSFYERESKHCAAFKRYYVKGKNWTKAAELGLDVYAVESKIIFFVRDDASGRLDGARFAKLERLVKLIYADFKKEPRRGKGCNIQYVADFSGAYSDVDGFCRKISKIVGKLSDKKKEIEQLLTK